MSGVARLALGTAQLGLAYGVANRVGIMSEAEAHSILESAFASGIDCVDTAPAYGSSQVRIGRFLRETGRRLRVVTKMSPPPLGLSEVELDAFVENDVRASLQALQVESVYALLLHSSDSLRAYEKPLVNALVRLKRRGLIEHLGVSVYDPAELELVRARPEISALQFPFNLFDRRFAAPGVLSAWRREGTALFARSAFLQGLLTLEPGSLPPHVSRARPWLELLRSTLAEIGLEPVVAALDFARARSGADYVVAGAETPAQLRGWAGRRELMSTERERRLIEPFESVPAEVFDPRLWESK